MKAAISSVLIVFVMIVYFASADDAGSGSGDGYEFEYGDGFEYEYGDGSEYEYGDGFEYEYGDGSEYGPGDGSKEYATECSDSRQDCGGKIHKMHKIRSKRQKDLASIISDFQGI